jgi:hypothetical protein
LTAADRTKIDYNAYNSEGRTKRISANTSHIADKISPALPHGLQPDQEKGTELAITRHLEIVLHRVLNGLCAGEGQESIENKNLRLRFAAEAHA